MNNSEIQKLLDDCAAEVDRVRATIDMLGQTSSIVPFLTKYSIVRTCGSIEMAYKSLIADYCSWRSKPQVKTYIDNNVRDSSRNPSYDNICQLLEDFDPAWNQDFKRQSKALANWSDIKLSLASLVEARNDFAHGGNPSITIADVVTHFTNARRLIEVLDSMLVP